MHKSYFDMLNIGIVGLKNAAPFIEAIGELPDFCFKGIYDPSLLIDHSRPTDFNVFQSFGDLCGECGAVVFSIDDNLYHPLVCEAIRHSLDVFVAGVQNYQTKELNELLTLRDEACCTVHVGHPFICTRMFRALRHACNHPLDVQCNIVRSANTNLVSLARTELSLLLTLVRASVHRVAVNVYSSFSSVPDTIRVRLDFDNGAAANICIDRYGLTPAHTIKAVNYNSIVEADLVGNLLTTIDSESPEMPDSKIVAPDSLTPLAMQLKTFQICLLSGSETHNSLENEIRTQLACQRIHEKMRINFNVF